MTLSQKIKDSWNHPYMAPLSGFCKGVGQWPKNALEEWIDDFKVGYNQVPVTQSKFLRGWRKIGDGHSILLAGPASKVFGGICGGAGAMWGTLLMSSTLAAKIGYGITACVFGATFGTFAGPFITMAGIAAVTGVVSTAIHGIPAFFKGIKCAIDHAKDPTIYMQQKTAQKLLAPQKTSSSTASQRPLDTVFAGIETCDKEQRDIFLDAWLKKYPDDFNTVADKALEQRQILHANNTAALAEDLIIKKNLIKFKPPEK